MDTFADTALKLSNCGGDLSFSKDDLIFLVSRFFAKNKSKKLLKKQGFDISYYSNFLNFEWLSSTENSYEDLLKGHHEEMILKKHLRMNLTLRERK